MIYVLMFFFYALFWIVAGIKNAYISRRAFILSFLLLASIIIALVFQFDPGIVEGYSADDKYNRAVWDVYRYYIEIDEFKGQSIMVVIPQMLSRIEPLRVGLFYLLSFMESKKWISVLSTVFSLGVVCKETLKQNHSKLGISVRAMVLCTLFFFCAIDILDLINTCRIIIAYSLFVIGVEYFQGKQNLKIYGCLMIIVASLLHVSCWLLGIIVVYSLVNLSYKKVYLLLFWQFVAGGLGMVLSHFPSTILQHLSVLLLNKTFILRFSLPQVLYYLLVLWEGVCIFGLISQLYRNGKLNGFYYRIESGICLLLIGGFGTILATRLLYILALLFPTIIYPVYNSDNKRVYLFKVMCIIGGAIIIMIYHIAFYRVYFLISNATWFW